jgi:hypothetical protein
MKKLYLMFLILLIMLFLSSCSLSLTKGRLKSNFINDFYKITDTKLKTDDIVIVGKYGDGYVLQVHIAKNITGIIFNSARSHRIP